MSAVRSFITRVGMPKLLTVTPTSSLLDSKVAIRATGLEANSRVTIRSVLEQETKTGLAKYEAHGHYIADDRGVVSLPDQISLGGTYTGTEAMGLFLSIQPSLGQRLGNRFVVKDIRNPMVVNLSLYCGHLNMETLQTAEPEATATAQKWYMSKDVEKIPVHSGSLRGSLFKPTGPGPFPGVIDMHGSVGGLIEIRAAMLASHGLASYALPYFNYGDLPSHMWNLELEYFKEAVDWMADQPFVRPEGIGMVGISTGGQNALATVSHFPEKVKAVVSISGCHVQNIFPMTLKGQPLPFVEFDSAGIEPSEKIDGAKETFDSYKGIYDVKENDDSVFKLENAPNCHFLFICGEDDAVWDSCHYAQEAMHRLARHGCHNYQLLSYPNTGHLMDVPYIPASTVAYSPFIRCPLNQGGTVVGTAKATEDYWPKIIRFLHAHCGRGNYGSKL
ncbi:acyl-coenzyme A amino acid N-acyltransferase 2-like [Acanthaster planci]|uniref:Acyl-coenzyme A amino acid N-acyltransferase 2-like n=1 Tax=Acanthaster planci TaxID=133434 RepID=A0A8B7YN75_ACAPL|nr:acyl-coenzyme A amino acid N-acyltransferase 2-like [Acanthaster planci]